MGARDGGRIRASTRRAHRDGRTAIRRRRFVELLGAGCVGTGLAGCLASTDNSNARADDRVRIVYAIARDDPDDPRSMRPRTKTVPAAWYDEVEAAFAAHTHLDVDLDGVFTTGVVPGEHGRDGTRVRVELSHEDLADRIPDVIDRIPVTTDVVGEPDERERELPRGGHSVELGDEVPGGVPCGNGDGTATLAPALYGTDVDARFFVTTNHLYGGDGTDRRGEPCYVETVDGTVEIGTVERGYAEEDFVLIDPSQGFVPTHEIRNASSSTVVGQFTRWGLADLKARGRDLEKVGIASGHTSGPIQAIDAFTCAYGTVCQRAQLTWGSEDDFTDGDSGSVSYHQDPEHPDEGIMIASFNNARTWWPGADYVWGTAAYAIEERYGFVF